MSMKQKFFTAGFVLAAFFGGMSAPSFAAGDHLITMQQADIRAFINLSLIHISEPTRPY